MLTEPTEATFRSIDRHRAALAKVRGTGRNAVDQMLVGNSHDAYAPFRERFQQEVLAGCNVQAYIDDMETIRRSVGHAECNLTHELTAKLEQDAKVSGAVLDAIQDGMDYAEARKLIRLIPTLQDTLDKILSSAYRTAGQNVRRFAHDAALIEAINEEQETEHASHTRFGGAHVSTETRKAVKLRMAK